MSRPIAMVLLSAALAPRFACPAIAGVEGGPSLRWVEEKGRSYVEVVGLDPARIDELRGLKPTDPAWPAILSARIARPPGEPAADPMLGRYEVVGASVRFTPRYPLRSGMQYIARFQPSEMKAQRSSDPPIEIAHTIPAKPPGPAAFVSAVYPTADVLPENQLKLYLHFSEPMARGEAYRRVLILDEAGHAVEHPFLEIGEELWDAEGRRLTLLFDPGRIKRGLVPREQEGPILEAGKTYTFVVDAAWLDAEGKPLREGFRKRFRTGPPDDLQPAPAQWKIDPVRPGTREPLTVRFPEPLDHAMLGRAIGVAVAGRPILGRVEVGAGETSWRFSPDKPWPEGPLTLQVDSELEDLAGNSIARPFEVDVIRSPADEQKPRIVAVPVPSPR